MDLRGIPAFSALSDEDLDYLKQISKRYSFGRREVLFYQGDAPTHLHIVLVGVVRLYRIDQNDKEITIGCFGKNSMVAEFANMKNIPFPSNAEFVKEGEILKIEFSKFRERFLPASLTEHFFFKTLIQKFDTLHNLIDRTLVLDVVQRVGKVLLEQGELFELLKNYEIASLLKITPETLSRSLRKLKNMGLIESDNSGKILIVDAQKMRLFLNS